MPQKLRQRPQTDVGPRKEVRWSTEKMHQEPEESHRGSQISRRRLTKIEVDPNKSQRDSIEFTRAPDNSEEVTKVNYPEGLSTLNGAIRWREKNSLSSRSGMLKRKISLRPSKAGSEEPKNRAGVHKKGSRARYIRFGPP